LLLPVQPAPGAGGRPRPARAARAAPPPRKADPYRDHLGLSPGGPANSGRGASPPPTYRYRGVPDSPNLSSALGETVTEGRQFLARVESLAGAISTELEGHERAGREWASERQALKDEVERRRGQVEAL